MEELVKTQLYGVAVRLHTHTHTHAHKCRCRKTTGSEGFWLEKKYQPSNQLRTLHFSPSATLFFSYKL